MSRAPDLVIGDNYLYRWYLVPRNRFLNVYLHHYHDSDDDRALHDHPWYSVSFLYKGELLEHTAAGVRYIPHWWPVFRSAKFAHRLQLVKGPAKTLFITGPRFRQWGFYCPDGWRHWSVFTDESGSRIGRGCGD